MFFTDFTRKFQQKNTGIVPSTGSIACSLPQGNRAIVGTRTGGRIANILFQMGEHCLERLCSGPLQKLVNNHFRRCENRTDFPQALLAEPVIDR